MTTKVTDLREAQRLFDTAERRNGDSLASLVRGITPAPPGPKYPVLQLEGADKVDAVMLCKSVWGVHIHWNDGRGKHGRSERCTLDTKKTCVGCDNRRPKRWKGYIHLYDFLRRTEAFLELTPGAFVELGKQVPAGAPLRGLRLQAARGGSSKYGPLHVTVGLFTGDHASLPPELDPEPVLTLLWEWQ